MGSMTSCNVKVITNNGSAQGNICQSEEEHSVNGLCLPNASQEIETMNYLVLCVLLKNLMPDFLQLRQQFDYISHCDSGFFPERVLCLWIRCSISNSTRV